MTEQEKSSLITQKLDLLRLKIIQQREVTEQIATLYTELNELHGNPVSIGFDKKIKNTPGWQPDPNYVKPPVTPETQVLRDHQLSRDF